nr:hypothetical protein CFP56_68474 [Quercus suber]
MFYGSTLFSNGSWISVWDIKFRVDEQILELKGKLLVSLISYILSNYSRSEIIERECLDPFKKLECEAFDIFVNEVLCVGKGCPYSCVKWAPYAFSLASTGSAKGFFTSFKTSVDMIRIILEELLDSILSTPYSSLAEAEMLYSLMVKAKFENNRCLKPKKQPKTSTQHVGWF